MFRFFFIIILLSVSVLAVTAQAPLIPCPTISVNSNVNVVQPGDSISFAATIMEGAIDFPVKFKWSIDKGTLIEGQGSKKIVVDSTGLQDTAINATLKIEGMPANCKNQVSTAVVIDSGVIYHPWYELIEENVPVYEQYALLDNFMIWLQNGDPKQMGVIRTTIKPDESINQARKRFKVILKHFNHRKFETNRIIFIVERGDKPETLVRPGEVMLYFILDKSELFNCKECEILKPSQIK